MQIAHLVLNVSNFEKSRVFYDTLFKELRFSMDYFESTKEVSVVSYRSEFDNIWIKCEHQITPTEFIRNPGLDHIGFLVSSSNEVDRIFEVFKKLEYIITRTPQYYPEYSEKYYAFYFRDPDEIPLEILSK